MAVVTVCGRLGGDPEIKQVSGSQVLEFSMAETIGRDESRWWRVSVWGKRGESLHGNGLLFKGRHVTVIGRISRAEAFTDKQGNARVGLDISATEVDIGPRQEQGGGQQQGQQGGGWGGGNGGNSGGRGGNRPAQQGGGWGSGGNRSTAQAGDSTPF